MLGDEDLVLGRGCAMIRAASWTVDAPDVLADELDLADVDTRAHVEPAGAAPRCGSRRHSEARAPGRRTSRACRRRWSSTSRPPNRSSSARAASKCSESSSRQRGVAEPRRHRRRVDEIGEQQRREHAAVDPGREPGERADPCPLDLHAGLVADGPAVVAGRNVEDVVGAELELGPVPQAHPEPTREHDAEMARLAPLAADRGRTCSDQRQPGSLTM